MESDRLDEELRLLKELLDRGEIAEADYEKERQRLLARPDPFATAEGDSYHPRRPTRLSDLAPGMEIGPEDNRFRLVREIGGGAMGRVWLAHDLAEEELEGGERYKALKVVNPLLQDSPRALEMLKREAMQASRLSHPNIINVYGWRQGRDGWLFVLMDYLEGRDLDRLLLDKGRPGLSWEQTLELLEPIAAGLDYAHKQNIIHRDLKPGNVFITKAGEVKLLDFGLAYRLHRSSSMVRVQESSSSGTPEYMPPEAFAAGVPEKAQDIYALACITYEMLTGEPPYSRESAVQRSPDLMPGKPELLTEAAWEVLKSGLAYRKEYRPDSAGELVRQLEAAQALTKTEEVQLEPDVPEKPLPEFPKPAPAEARKPKEEPPQATEPHPEKNGGHLRRVGKSWLMGLMILAAVVVGIYLWWEPGPAPIPKPAPESTPTPKVERVPEPPSAKFELTVRSFTGPLLRKWRFLVSC